MEELVEILQEMQVCQSLFLEELEEKVEQMKMDIFQAMEVMEVG